MPHVARWSVSLLLVGVLLLLFALPGEARVEWDDVMPSEADGARWKPHPLADSRRGGTIRTPRGDIQYRANFSGVYDAHPEHGGMASSLSVQIVELESEADAKAVYENFAEILEELHADEGVVVSADLGMETYVIAPKERYVVAAWYYRNFAVELGDSRKTRYDTTLLREVSALVKRKIDAVLDTPPAMPVSEGLLLEVPSPRVEVRAGETTSLVPLVRSLGVEALRSVHLRAISAQPELLLVAATERGPYAREATVRRGLTAPDGTVGLILYLRGVAAGASSVGLRATTGSVHSEYVHVTVTILESAEPVEPAQPVEPAESAEPAQVRAGGDDARVLETWPPGSWIFEPALDAVEGLWGTEVVEGVVTLREPKDELWQTSVDRWTKLRDEERVLRSRLAGTGRVEAEGQVTAATGSLILRGLHTALTAVQGLLDSMVRLFQTEGEEEVLKETGLALSGPVGKGYQLAETLAVRKERMDLERELGACLGMRRGTLHGPDGVPLRGYLIDEGDGRYSFVPLGDE